MKNRDSIVGWAFVLSLIMIMLVIGDFLALHDIRMDYVSPGVLEDFSEYDSDSIPEWAATRMEWIFVRISLLLKVIIIPFILVALARSIKRFRV